MQNRQFETNPVRDTYTLAHLVEMHPGNVFVRVHVNLHVFVLHIDVSFLSSVADLRIAVHHSVAFAPGKAEWTDFGDDGRRL